MCTQSIATRQQIREHVSNVRTSSSLPRFPPETSVCACAVLVALGLSLRVNEVRLMQNIRSNTNHFDRIYGIYIWPNAYCTKHQAHSRRSFNIDACKNVQPSVQPECICYIRMYGWWAHNCR